MSLSPDIVRKARKRLPEILSRLARREAFEPFEIPLPKASSARAAADIQACHHEAKHLESIGFSVRRQSVANRSLGTQTIPVALEIQSLAQLGKAVGDRHLGRFAHLSRSAIRRFPGLASYWSEHPLEAWAQRGNWGRILVALRWLHTHPASGLHPREIPWCLHGKFIEEHEAILRRLLVFVASSPAYGSTESLVTLAGLRSREPLWRARLLDPRLVPNLPARDLAMSLDDWMRILPQPWRLLVVENLESFLALGPRTETVALWGRGFAVVKLAPWIRCAGSAFYWGDLDAQGFEILDALRREAPVINSFAMDGHALATFPHLASSGTGAACKELDRLDRAEWAAYRQVVTANLRLEQEKLPMRWLEAELDDAMSHQASWDNS